MRALSIAAITLAVALTCPAGQARPPTGGAVVTTQGWGYGGGWGPYRPWYGPGYGRWGYGYPGYGFGVGFGYGGGWGSPWYWGAPSVVYAAPAFYPFGVVAPSYPALTVREDLTYVQMPQAAGPEAAVPSAAPADKPASLWYYCTEPAGYHPYVAQCTRPWIGVNPSNVPAAQAPR